MQAEGEFAPGRDGRGSRRGGGVGGRGRGSRGHGEATVSTDLAENLTPRSLGPQGADRLGQYDSFSRLQRDLRGLHLFVKDLLVFTVPLLLLLLLALPVGLVPVQLVLRLGVQLLWQERLQGKAI